MAAAAARGGKHDARRADNPRHAGDELEAARDFRREFHWGYPARKVSKRHVSPPPRVAVKLGELHSVTYRTHKKGESARLFEHEFEGRRPWLAMNIKDKRLHLLGGDYTVTADGITG